MVIDFKKLLRKLSFLTIFTACFGTPIPIFGIKKSVYLFVIFESIAVILFYGEKGIPLYKSKEKKIMIIFAFVWLLWTLCAFPRIVDYDGFYVGLGQVAGNAILIILIVFTVFSVKDIVQYLKAIQWIFFINLILGLFEKIFGIHFIEIDERTYADIRVFDQNPNEYAVTLLISYLAYVFLRSKRKAYKLEFLVDLLCLYCIYYTTSRGVLLSFLFFWIVYIIAILSIHIFQNGKKIKYFWMHIIFVILLIMIIILSFYGIRDIISLVDSNESDVLSDFYRIDLIERSWQIAISNYLMGAGAYQTTYYLKMNPHNFVFEMLADYGIVISIFVFYFFYKIMCKIGNKKFVRSDRAFFFSFTPSMILVSCVSSNTFKFRLFWVILVLIFFYGQLDSNPLGERIDKRYQQKLGDINEINRIYT